MTVPFARRLTGCLIVAIGVVAAGTAPITGQAKEGDADRPVVHEALVDSVIQPVAAEYMIATLNRADATARRWSSSPYAHLAASWTRPARS